MGFDLGVGSYEYSNTSVTLYIKKTKKRIISLLKEKVPALAMRIRPFMAVNHDALAIEQEFFNIFKRRAIY